MAREMDENKVMRLYATGFNAWNQLSFDACSTTETAGPLPQDLSEFTSILQAPKIEHPKSLLASTHVQTSAGIRSAGFPSPFDEHEPLTRKLLSSRLAVADNEKVAVITDQDTIQQYASLTHYQADSEADFTFTVPKTDLHIFSQIVAYEAGFAALATAKPDDPHDSRVFTWGDERYSASLGREVTKSSPADRPCVVEDLVDLPTGPIVKVAAGGYTLLALTEGCDLYSWGGHPGRPAAVLDLADAPEPVDVASEDIKDCAMGDQHAVVLTTSGTVFVIGHNTNGQLGFPGVDKAHPWKQASLSLSPHDRIVGVEAGSRTSFILVESLAS